MGDRARSAEAVTEVEQWILEAVETLLGRMPLHEMTIPAILKECGMARSTFYAYYSSKNAAVTAVIARTMDQMYAATQPWLADDGLTVFDTLRGTIERSAADWEQHGPVLCSLVENEHVIPELQAIWQANVERFVEAISTRIDADRAAGIAPHGIDSRRLATGLIWTGRLFFYLGTKGIDPNVPTMKEALETLTPMWLGSIYGHSADLVVSSPCATATGPTVREEHVSRR